MLMLESTSGAKSLFYVAQDTAALSMSMLSIQRQFTVHSVSILIENRQFSQKRHLKSLCFEGVFGAQASPSCPLYNIRRP